MKYFVVYITADQVRGEPEAVGSVPAARIGRPISYPSEHGQVAPWDTVRADKQRGLEIQYRKYRMLGEQVLPEKITFFYIEERS